MTLRFTAFAWIAAVLIFGSAVPVMAEPAEWDSQIVQRTYCVGDILGLLGDHQSQYAVPPSSALQDLLTASTAQDGQQPPHEQLIALITDIIEPQSWSSKGGRGTIDYFPLGKALI